MQDRAVETKRMMIPNRGLWSVTGSVEEARTEELTVKTKQRSSYVRSLCLLFSHPMSILPLACLT